ncbi:General stress protein 14 [compost metagenome]
MVLTYGWAYGESGVKLHGKELLLAISTGGIEESYKHDGKNKYTIQELLRPFEATSNLIGTKLLPYFVQHGAMGLTDEELASSVEKYVQVVLA